MKVLSVVGARPQFVKAAPVSRALRIDHAEVLVHTGQHYDDAMSAAFFRDLDLPAPDVDLEVGSGSHGAQTAEMIRRLEPVVAEAAPDVVVVYGDTNSTLAGALVAAKMAYPNGRRPMLAHVEAGLRSFNPAMPEERNRVIADHLSDVLLAPTATALGNLAAEGLAERATVVGDVMVDAFRAAAPRAAAALPPAAAERPGYVLLTLHRPANVDDPRRLAAWLDAMADAGPVIFPVHPRTAASLARDGARVPENVTRIDPVGYLAMIALERDARVIATDSGGVQKEAYLAGVPCVTLRTETEWVETLDGGWNRLSPEPEDLAGALAEASRLERDRPRLDLFGDGQAAARMVAAIERRLAFRGAAAVRT